MAINKMGVLGAGTMGAGIAQVAAQSGLQVIMTDLDQAFLDRAIKGITKNWDRDVSKGKITEQDKGNFMKNITTSTHNIDFADCDLVIEAIVENIDIKRRSLRILTTFAATYGFTNTSGFSITEIAASGRRIKW